MCAHVVCTLSTYQTIVIFQTDNGNIWGTIFGSGPMSKRSFGSLILDLTLYNIWIRFLSTFLNFNDKISAACWDNSEFLVSIVYLGRKYFFRVGNDRYEFQKSIISSRIDLNCIKIFVCAITCIFYCNFFRGLCTLLHNCPF